MGGTRRQNRDLAEPFFGAILDASPDALLALDTDGIIRLANTASSRLFGYSREELVGSEHALLLSGPSGTAARQLLDDLQAEPGLPLPPREVRMLHRDGTAFAAEMAGSLIDDAGPRLLLLSYRSTSHRKPADAELREAMSLLTATLQSTADGILVIGADGKIAGLNDQFLKMWGIPPEHLEAGTDEPAMQVVLAQVKDPEDFLARVAELTQNPTAESHDVVDFLDGRTFERYSRPQRVGSRVVGRVWSFRDVTPRRQAQELAQQAQEQAQAALRELAFQAEKLRAMAFTDPLTGLANRAVFNNELLSALTEPRLKSVDVFLIDLDDFKEVNDILGHHAGDVMLVEVARRLRGCVPTADVVARLGGDEFVVLLTACPNAEAIAECIVRCLHVPFSLEGTMLRPSLSLGLASIGRHPKGASELLREADIAMYAAKAAGKNRFLRFHPDMMTALVKRTDLEAGLQLSVARGEISVEFQPIVSPRMGRVVKFEALARWDRGCQRVPPALFIPLAERSGLINELGGVVMALSLKHLASWLREDPSRSLSMNVSGVQLQEADFAESVLRLAEEYGVGAYQLVLEVTESVFFDADCNVIKQLSRLRAAGARVALDDFGTGYSSLGRLQELPVDIIKIDKTFVSMVRTGNERLPILSSMINMAHSLGLTVTAEGIETEEQANYLIALECDSLQGYLFSHPEPAGRFESALQNAGDALDALSSRSRLA
ncbi:putative bifunctional diguanylate cyclase/phosphodiesterase [Pseudarthrobacter sulfonivorans]|uniref:putative bifunctional diguanylate cyclase/phosphodiesterase n=1 Tax=Pseudarthrobacter sulfonivorans TaxID=121292 RepID=UPI0021022A38|nr:EAL domain-containing protein [Pseudarthrobacter sulfonivorans]